MSGFTDNSSLSVDQRLLLGVGSDGSLDETWKHLHINLLLFDHLSFLIHLVVDLFLTP